MSASELVQATVYYLEQVSPFLLVFFAISMADKLIDLVNYAVNGFRTKRGYDDV